MFEIISITPVDVQHEIITCLPEVVDDAQHSDVTNKLKCDIVDNRRHDRKQLLTACFCISVLFNRIDDMYCLKCDETTCLVCA